MATDTLTLNPGTGGSELSVNDLAGGEKCQNIKILSAEDASETQIYAGAGLAANALRVELPTDGTGVVGLNASTASIGTVGLNTGTNSVGTVGLDAGTAAIGSVIAAGAIAHDSAVSTTFPVLISGEARGTNIGGAVDEGDMCRLKTTLEGRLLTSPFDTSPQTDNDNQTSAQTNTNIVNAPAAGNSLYICDIIVSVDGAQTISFAEDGSGTPVLKVPVLNLAADQCINLHFTSPIMCSDGVNFAYTTTTTAQTSVMVNWYSSKV